MAFLPRSIALIGFVFLPALTGCASLFQFDAIDGGRPERWAEPIESRTALENFHRVGPGLYRGAQLDSVGAEVLAAAGVRTIINLRTTDADAELAEIDRIRTIHLPVNPFVTREEDLIEFLRLATDPALRPLFVHCRHGADRTGMMLATYRVVVQGWTKEEAIREMRRGGYGHHWIFFNLSDAIDDLDVEAMRRRLGIEAERAGGESAIAAEKRPH